MNTDEAAAISRRALRGGAVAASGIVLERVSQAQQLAAMQTPAPSQPIVPVDPTVAPRPGSTATSARSPFEQPAPVDWRDRRRVDGGILTHRSPSPA